jgi:hypothetical protein
MHHVLAVLSVAGLAGLPAVTESVDGAYDGANMPDAELSERPVEPWVHERRGVASGKAAAAMVAAADASPADAGGQPIEFAISAEDLVTPEGRTLRGLEPLSIQARLTGTDARYTLRNLQLRIGKIELAGEVTVDSTAAVPIITGTLMSRILDLRTLLPEADANAGRQRDRLFSTTSLPLQAPSALNARVDLRASEINMPPLELHNFEATVVADNGTLTIDSLRAQLAGGTVEGRLSLDATADPPVVDLDVKATGIVPEQLPQVAASGVVRGAPTDLTLKLRGQGRSVADILGSSKGHFLVSVGPGELGDAATGVGILDAVFGLVRGLNPLAVSQKPTQLQCAVLNFRVQDGVAANETGVGVQTDSLNILGGGAVNLKTEQIDMAGKPKRRKTGVLGLTGVESVVRVGGTLSKPEVATGASVGAGTVGRIGAAWATGGLTLLASGVLDRMTFGDDVCTVALAQKPRE